MRGTSILTTWLAAWLFAASACAQPDDPPAAPPATTAWDLATATATQRGLQLEVADPEALREVPVSGDAPLRQAVSAAGWFLEERDGILRIRPRRGALEVEQAALAVSLGDCHRALELLRPDRDPAQALAAASCSNRLGLHADAIDLLPDPPGPLQPWVRWERAQALHGLDRSEEALAALDGLELPGAPGLRLRLLRATLREDPAALGALADTRVGGEARLRQADLQVGEARRSTLLSLWAEARSPYDAEAAARLQADGLTVPDLSTPEGRALAQQRAKALDRAHRVEEALDLVEALRRLQPPRTSADHLELARARMRGKAYPAARESFEAALGTPEAAVGGPEPLHDYALTVARTGDYATSSTIYRRLMAQHPGSGKADTASFKLGYMAWDEGDCDRALPLLRDHRAARPSSRHLDEALWFESRCHWKSGELDAMDAVLDELLRKRPSSSLVPGARYWQARIAGLRGDADKERAALEEVLRRHPRTGYAWFAAERLEHRFPARPAAQAPSWPQGLASDPAAVRARSLLSVGLREAARAELGQVRAQGKEAQLALAWARIEAGDFRGGQRLARQWCSSTTEDTALQACAPRPEHPIVSSVLSRKPLDPLLPYGIMNAESALDPAVTSPAGARGLMQLMPAVAADLHTAAFGTDDFDPDRLYAAPYNAALGTWELADRAESLQGTLRRTDLPAVAASYNGGEDAVRRWLSTWPEPPEPDEFTEEIGYTETRRYVKRVLGFVMALREVYGDP